MGGTSLIGYVGDERTLAIDTAHATVVHGIYERYLILGSKHILSPQRSRLSGALYGGRPFSRGNLHRIVKNNQNGLGIIFRKHWLMTDVSLHRKD